MSDAQRRFKDCDGDTWTEYEPGMLRLTERAHGIVSLIGMEESVEDATRHHGPLTEIRPDVDVRALLADVLDDLATSVGGYESYGDEMTQEIGYRMREIFADKARELREGLTSVRDE
ncbi:hypothetical protein [Streptomyces scopuliridis]|uniref:Uncharacterized protein n=1 Tax=Streptomyces scopuliridis TaxID=452529 RepID=A0ACD4ZSX0_9ACTN|nr:hypothetical protein [Streptomyces scopuliridis]WSC01251.1 hypothetical protein OG835_32470 [Streptomyces scopuliridis]